MITLLGFIGMVMLGQTSVAMIFLVLYLLLE